MALQRRVQRVCDNEKNDRPDLWALAMGLVVNNIHYNACVFRIQHGCNLLELNFLNEFTRQLCSN